MKLLLKDVTIKYGTAVAVNTVSLEVDEGSIVSIIGANGAGKSTLLKAIGGLKKIAMGTIAYQNQLIHNLKPYQLVKQGIVLIPENRRLFWHMSVLENIKMGAYLQKSARGMKESLDETFELFPKLKTVRHQEAATLSGGEQQLTSIARALMAKPKLLLMDEPSVGLAPLVIERLAETIKTIHQKGITILLVEQNAGLVQMVSQKTYLLEIGRMLQDGTTEQVMKTKAVKHAFLGDEG